MADRMLLDELITKLRESLLASRIRHLSILAIYVRSRLEKVKESAALPNTQADGRSRDASGA